LPALRRFADRRAVTYARLGRAACLRGLGRLAEARNEVDRSVAEFHALDDQHGHARALCLLGQIARDQDQEPAALAACEYALRISRDLGEPLNEAQGLQASGFLQLRRQSPRDALDALHASLALATELDHKPTQAYSLAALATAHAALHHDRQAIHYRDHAIALFTDLDDPHGLATLTCLEHSRS
jgi:tetratricopeptide (TPR) repeat protein